MQDVPLVRLPLHFDVPSERLNADDYLVAVKSLKTCLSDFNGRLFDGQIDYELFILPSESGSFKGVTGLVFRTLTRVAIIGGIMSGLETDLMKGFVKGITGYELDYYVIAKEAGESTLNTGEFFVDLTTGFFSTETEELERLTPNTVNLDKAFHAKTDFYNMCLNNKSIAGVGFADEHKFPVRRNRFLRHLSREKIRPVESYFVLCNAIVVSPVDIDVNRMWRFRDTKTGSFVNAYMGDEDFKTGFLSGKYPLKISQRDDRVTMLVEYSRQERNGEVESGKAYVRTVYSFNDKKLKVLPKNQEPDARFTGTKELPMGRFWTR